MSAFRETHKTNMEMVRCGPLLAYDLRILSLEFKHIF